MRLAERCGPHRGLSSSPEENIYAYWITFGVLLIPIACEYWSIKAKKKNPLSGNSPAILTAILLPLVMAIAGYALYYASRHGN